MIENFYKEIKMDADFFVAAANHVVEWNAKARGGAEQEFTNEMFVSQIGCVREELKEFQDAAKDNDHVEMLDAAADSFVVTSYLAYMFFGKEVVEQALRTPVGDCFAPDIYNGFMSFEENIVEARQMAMFSLALMRQARDTLVRTRYNGKKVLKEVLKSNDSKYPTRKQLLEAWGTKDINEAVAKECGAIEERSQSRAEGAYEGVTATYNEVQKVYVFWDKNGKIMKPSTFVKPDIASIIV